MKFKNVSPLGALDLPLVGRVVGPGEVIEVSAAQARHLQGQSDWVPVTRKSAQPDPATDGADVDQTQED